MSARSHRRLNICKNKSRKKVICLGVSEEKRHRFLILDAVQFQSVIAHDFRGWRMSKETRRVSQEIKVLLPFCLKQIVKDFLIYPFRKKTKGTKRSAQRPATLPQGASCASGVLSLFHKFLPFISEGIKTCIHSRDAEMSTGSEAVLGNNEKRKRGYGTPAKEDNTALRFSGR